MKSSIALALATLVIITGCSATDPTPNPAGAMAPNASATPASTQQSQLEKDRKLAHAMESASMGAAVGGAAGGPFGALGMGLIGFVYSLVTSDSRLAEERAKAQAQTAQAQARYQTEAEKDRALEMAIEQEIERQRALENPLTGATGKPVSSQPAKLPQQVSQPVQTTTNSPTPSGTAAPITVARASALPAPPPFRNVEVRDINNDGVPDIWIYYNPQKPGEIMRQEEATKNDGRVDAWSYYQDGQLVRRDVDRRGNGRPDTIYYYEKDKIVREERDEAGQGRMTYRASYQNGRLEKVEKDSTGQGRPDLWIYYDTSRDGEIVVKEERDLNGDGVADLWSFFDNGRLVRRDVNAPGLEILSKQDQLPLPSAEIRPPTIPGS